MATEKKKKKGKILVWAVFMVKANQSFLAEIKAEFLLQFSIELFKNEIS